MRSKCLLLWAAFLAGSAILAPSAPAAVTGSQFPPNTVRDLIAICSAGKDDPRMTAAVNFCHGFVEGAVIVEEANEAHKGARKLFCLPTPRPSTGLELTSFIAWTNEQPARLDMPSIDGVFIHLAQRFPCPEEAGARPRAR